MVGQGGGIDLEQFVARIDVQNRLQGFGRVAVGHDARDSHHVGHASPHLRDIGHCGGIGGRGVKPQKAGLSDHLAGVVKALDGDVVEPGRAVHGGARHGLGDQHQFIGFKQGHGLGWQARHCSLRGAAQDAQARLRPRDQADGVAIALDVIVARAQKGEVPVFQPVQEFNAFLLAGLRQRRPRHRQPQGLNPLEHGIPVLHDAANVAQHPIQVTAQRFPFCSSHECGHIPP